MSPWAFLTDSSFGFDLFISDSGSAYWGIFLKVKLATYLKWLIVYTSCLSWCSSVSENTGTIWCSYSSIFRGACFLNCWWHKKIKNFLAIWKKELLETTKTRRGLLSNNNKTHVYLIYLMLQANALPHCQTLDIINTMHNMVCSQAFLSSWLDTFSFCLSLPFSTVSQGVTFYFPVVQTF